MPRPIRESWVKAYAIAAGSKLERGVARDSLGPNTAGTHLAQRGPPCILQTCRCRLGVATAIAGSVLVLLGRVGSRCGHRRRARHSAARRGEMAPGCRRGGRRRRHRVGTRSRGRLAVGDARGVAIGFPGSPMRRVALRGEVRDLAFFGDDAEREPALLAATPLGLYRIWPDGRVESVAPGPGPDANAVTRIAVASRVVAVATDAGAFVSRMGRAGNGSRKNCHPGLRRRLPSRSARASSNVGSRSAVNSGAARFARKRSAPCRRRRFASRFRSRPASDRRSTSHSTSVTRRLRSFSNPSWSFARRRCGLGAVAADAATRRVCAEARRGARSLLARDRSRPARRSEPPRALAPRARQFGIRRDLRSRGRGGRALRGDRQRACGRAARVRFLRCGGKRAGRARFFYCGGVAQLSRPISPLRRKFRNPSSTRVNPMCTASTAPHSAT